MVGSNQYYDDNNNNNNNNNMNFCQYTKKGEKYSTRERWSDDDHSLIQSALIRRVWARASRHKYSDHDQSIQPMEDAKLARMLELFYKTYMLCFSWLLKVLQYFSYW